jgi:CBS-domain-containing membrane protein
VREAVGFHPEDFDRALAEVRETLDIAREDLELLPSRVEHHACERRALQQGLQHFLILASQGYL